MTYNTLMENLTTTVYTSPLTGTEYLVVPKSRSRVAYGEFMNPATKYIHEYTEYEIVLNGNKVQFCFDEAKVPEMVEHFENPGPDIGSRFD